MSIGRNRVKVVVSAAVVQWANGRTMFREAGGAGRFGPLVGFHTEVGKDGELDELARELAFPTIEIRHQGTGQGGGGIKRHWFLGETLRLYPVTAGPTASTVGGLIAAGDATAEAGIGVRWPDGEKSRLAVRGYLDSLIRADYRHPVQLSVRSLMTEHLLATLVDHVRVCEAADGLIDRGRHPDVVSLHEVALVLGAGQETPFGKGETTDAVPLRSAHPQAVDAVYLRGVWRPEVVAEQAPRDWASIQQWAREFAAGGEAGQPEPQRQPAYEDVI